MAETIPELALPEPGDVPVAIGEGDHPLLFDPSDVSPLSLLDDPATADQLYGLPTIPFPGEEEAADADPELYSLENPLVRMAVAVAPSVLTLRAWDEYGEEISNGAGFLIEKGGTVLTDANLIHPDISDRIDYITAADGFGKAYRVAGVWSRRLESGVALLKLEGNEFPSLELHDSQALGADGVAVRVIAVKDDGGLVLADALAKREKTVSGAGWMTVEGEDSSGAVGSPVIDPDGRVIGMVSMKQPGDHWINYAIPSGELMGILKGGMKQAVPVSALRDLRRSGPQNDPKLVSAYRNLYSGHTELATRSLLELTKTYPRSAICWAMLGLAAADLGARDDALACQRKAVALDPDVGVFWFQLALAHLRDSDAKPGAVEEALAKAVDKRPGDRLAWLLLAEARIRGGQMDGALDALKSVLKIEPDFARGHYLTGYVLGKTGQFAEARQSVLRSLSLDRASGEGWYLLGLLESREGRHGEAADAFERVTRYDKRHPKAWLNLAHAYRADGRENDARQAAKRHFSLLAEL